MLLLRTEGLEQNEGSLHELLPIQANPHFDHIVEDGIEVPVGTFVELAVADVVDSQQLVGRLCQLRKDLVNSFLL